ncbi:MAG: MGMT family protein [Dokdonella sp.]
MKSVNPDGARHCAAIRHAIASIPAGRVASYGQIAARAGLPGRARLVGRVLGEAPTELELPWHRVVRADGRSAFAPGSRGFREQVRRLAGEGILLRNGRVDLVVHGCERNLDDLLWGPPPAPRRKMRAPQ